MVKAVALTDSPSILPELFAVLLKFAAASLTVRSNTKDLRFRQKFSLFGEACMENVALTYQAWSLVHLLFMSFSLNNFIGPDTASGRNLRDEGKPPT